MRPKDIQAQPTVLRELSLLRALGTSLRTFSHRPARLARATLPPSPPIQPPDAFALLPRKGRPIMSDKRA